MGYPDIICYTKEIYHVETLNEPHMLKKLLYDSVLKYSTLETV